MLVLAPIRGCDKHGCGHYQAPRGKRKHKGVDIACVKNTKVLSPVEGVVTKIGKPYYIKIKDTFTAAERDKAQKKNALDYVEVTDGNSLRHRFFYVGRFVSTGQRVHIGTELGIAQGVADIYPGITEHFHYEILDKTGTPCDPCAYLKEAFGYEY